jgi:Fe-S-cluster-containing hydrogenase component 2
MAKRLTVVPERCSGCRLCELACAIHHHGVNNPKKSAIRVMVAFPHPVIRMPIVCRQCGRPKCAENCPENAIARDDGLVAIDSEKCIACGQCVIACPFGAIFVHDDLALPFKCDLCDGDPQCVRVCPKQAILYQPEHIAGQAHRMSSALRYAHMKEVTYVEEGEQKKLRYAEIGKPEA